jgi:hypothetical protein
VKLLALLCLILLFSMIICGQNSRRIVANGTDSEPLKHSFQPTVDSLSANEIAAVRREVLEKEISLDFLPQTSSEESEFKKDFELLDVAEGFFIYREIEFRAYLYKAYSLKIKQNYQGIIVFNITDNGSKFIPKAHYVYKYQGDKYIRLLPDINGNVLNEIAVFSAFQTKRNFRKMVRIIEFSPNGLTKFGAKEIYSSVPQKQRTPWSADKSKPAKKVYIPPIVTAAEIYAVFGFGKTLRFFADKRIFANNKWIEAENSNLAEIKLDEDSVNYLEIIKPYFPKGIGEK